MSRHLGRLAGPALAAAAVLAFLAGPAAPVQAGAILNTLQGYDRDERGWSGNLDGLFSASGGNTQNVSLATGGNVQWRGDRSRWRLLGSLDYQESDDVETARDAVLHLRHNYRLGGGPFATVAFAQVQHNPFQRLEERWLIGAGLRWNILDNERGVVSFGLTPMYESEQIKGETSKNTGFRLSSFVHARRNLREGVRLDLVVFYQPRSDEFANRRAVANLDLRIEITGALDLRTGAGWQHNSRPAAGVEKDDWSTYTGLSLEL